MEHEIQIGTATKLSRLEASANLVEENKAGFTKKVARHLKDFHKRFLNWVDAFWGYDVFIAHRRTDAAEYALQLYEALTAQRVSCFIDRAVYRPGDSLTVATRRHVAKSTLFILLGSPEILSPRKPKDWVKEEINEYLASHESDPKIIPIDFGETIVNAASPTNPILQRIEKFDDRSVVSGVRGQGDPGTSAAGSGRSADGNALHGSCG